MENDRAAKRVYVGSGASRSVSRPRKRWNDIVKDCLKKKKRYRCQASKEMYDRIEWQELVRGNAWVTDREMKIDLMR